MGKTSLISRIAGAEFSANVPSTSDRVAYELNLCVVGGSGESNYEKVGLP